MFNIKLLLLASFYAPLCFGASIISRYDRRSPLQTAPDLPRTWSYKGCFVDRIGGRTLKRATVTNAEMTGGMCARWCLEQGYNFAGTEWGRECYCGFEMHNPVLTRDDECVMSCAGRAGEACGGSQRITVYETLNADAPSTNPGVADFPLLGCYTDSVSARALPVRTGYEGNLNVSKCISACSLQGYALAGVEYGQECFCGNALDNDSQLIPGNADESHCDMLCTGAPGEFCGGSSRLNLYGALPIATPTSSPVLEPTPESAAVV